MVDDQVVGADGFLPMTIDTILEKGDSPFSFVALTLKKYSFPVSSPVTSACLTFLTDIELT